MSVLAVVGYLVVGLIAVTCGRRISVAVALGVLVGQLAVNHAVVPDVLAVAVAWMLGHTVRQRREFAEARRVAAAARAVQDERLRIARELHDLIAHSIGVVTIQAGVGSRVFDRRPDEARKALTVIEDIGRQTLTELRGMLGTLRRAESGSAAGSESVPPAPAPGLADLDRLVEQSRDAGLHVEVESHGERGPVPAGTDLSAFRIIQEALTNVARHAGADRCRVVVAQRPGELSIQIIDAGRGGAAGPGYGLVGMRERVTLLGGTFQAGPRPEGGFRVAAALPLPAAR
jgi:signal transduction histidine kinase